MSAMALFRGSTAQLPGLVTQVGSAERPLHCGTRTEGRAYSARCSDLVPPGPELATVW